jgi:hypothetical protein
MASKGRRSWSLAEATRVCISPLCFLPRVAGVPTSQSEHGWAAFLNVVMTICDVGDEVIIFTPYYFNHLMALQLINAKVATTTIQSYLMMNIE